MKAEIKYPSSTDDQLLLQVIPETQEEQTLLLSYIRQKGNIKINCAVQSKTTNGISIMILGKQK